YTTTSAAIRLFPPRRPTTSQASRAGCVGASLRPVCSVKIACSSSLIGSPNKAFRNANQEFQLSPRNQDPNRCVSVITSIIVGSLRLAITLMVYRFSSTGRLRLTRSFSRSSFASRFFTLTSYSNLPDLFLELAEIFPPAAAVLVFIRGQHFRSLMLMTRPIRCCPRDKILRRESDDWLLPRLLLRLLSHDGRRSCCSRH